MINDSVHLLSYLFTHTHCSNLLPHSLRVEQVGVRYTLHTYRLGFRLSATVATLLQYPYFPPPSSFGFLARSGRSGRLLIAIRALVQCDRPFPSSTALTLITRIPRLDHRRCDYRCSCLMQRVGIACMIFILQKSLSHAENAGICFHPFHHHHPYLLNIISISSDKPLILLTPGNIINIFGAKDSSGPNFPHEL